MIICRAAYVNENIVKVKKLDVLYPNFNLMEKINMYIQFGIQYQFDFK